MPARTSQRHYPLEDYFALAAIAPFKLEFFHGEILAMSGGSVAHNAIAANVLATLHGALRSGPCRVLGSDQRLVTPSGLWTYPDVAVYCGEIRTSELRADTATNPVVIVEVLSPSTRDYDRGEKLAMYREIPTVRHLLLIEQDAVAVEHHQRGPEGWSREVHDDLGASLSLGDLGSLSLRDVYERVFA